MRTPGRALITLVVCLLLLTGCTPDFTLSPRAEKVSGNVWLISTGGIDDGRVTPDDLRNARVYLVPHLEQDNTGRQWNAMPSNRAEGRTHAATTTTSGFEVDLADLDPGPYAVWLEWDRRLRGPRASDGYAILFVGPITVPDLVGSPLSEAHRVLQDSGLVAGTIEEATDPGTGPEPVVVSQSPSAGAAVDSLTEVDLRVGSG